MQTLTSEGLLKNLEKYLEDKSIYQDKGQADDKTRIHEFVVEILQNNKDIQSSLYTELGTKSGLVGKLKNIILNKVANITRNVVEKSFIKQQRYNNQVLEVLKYLLSENEELKARMKKLEERGEKQEA